VGRHPHGPGRGDARLPRARRPDPAARGVHVLLQRPADPPGTLVPDGAVPAPRPAHPRVATIAARESERAPRAGHHPRRGWAQRHQRAGDGGWVLRMRRVIAWAAGIAAMTGVSAAMLMTTVPGDRGRDEINLVTIHELPLPSGGVLTQAVPPQRASPYDIRLPYHSPGHCPARTHV